MGEITKGFQFDQGLLSPYFYTSQKDQKASYEDPLILVSGEKISQPTQAFLRILEHVSKERKSLLIIADAVDEAVMATLVLNKMHYGLKVVAVKAPGFGESKTSILQDIAIQTGAQMLSKEVGLNLDNVDISHLGTAKSVEVTKDTT